MLGADGGIVEAAEDGMRRGDLAVFVLQNVSVGALEGRQGALQKNLDARRGEAACSPSSPRAARFDADLFYVGIRGGNYKRGRWNSNAADAGEKMRGQALFRRRGFAHGFAADHALKIANHRGIGMARPGRSREIVRGADVGDPIAHGFVDGILSVPAAGIDTDDLRAEHAHTRDVEGLARHVFRAHVDGRIQGEMRGDGGGSDSVLASARSAMMRGLPIFTASKPWR